MNCDECHIDKCTNCDQLTAERDKLRDALEEIAVDLSREADRIITGMRGSERVQADLIGALSLKARNALKEDEG
jgi:hypothetical protein